MPNKSYYTPSFSYKIVPPVQTPLHIVHLLLGEKHLSNSVSGGRVGAAADFNVMQKQNKEENSLCNGEQEKRNQGQNDCNR